MKLGGLRKAGGVEHPAENTPIRAVLAVRVSDDNEVATFAGDADCRLELKTDRVGVDLKLSGLRRAGGAETSSKDTRTRGVPDCSSRR